jgi:branched-chain amino acid transport system permease protein
LAFLGLEEVLKGMTEHWMAVFGPLIVLVALFGRRGIAGWLEALDGRRAPPSAAAVPAPGSV